MRPEETEAWTSGAREECGFEGEPVCARMFSSHSIDSTRGSEAMPQSDNELSQQETKDGKVKRKVGRPIAYSGDPFSPDLEPEERRVILRRIANRESARRVRARRQDELERLSHRMQGVDDNNARLRATLRAAEAKEERVRGELVDLKGLLRMQGQETEALRSEIARLRHMLEVANEQLQLQHNMTSDKSVGPPPLLICPFNPFAPFQPSHTISEPTENPETPTGKLPSLPSEFTEESAIPLPLPLDLPHAPAAAAERSFSDILQDIAWGLCG